MRGCVAVFFCKMLQCVAVHYSVLQCDAAGSVVQYVAVRSLVPIPDSPHGQPTRFRGWYVPHIGGLVYCSVGCSLWQGVAICGSVLQCVAVCCSVKPSYRCASVKRSIGTHCNALQRTVMHCNTLQHAATCCNMLQHAATCCNML